MATLAPRSRLGSLASLFAGCVALAACSASPEGGFAIDGGLRLDALRAPDGFDPGGRPPRCADGGAGDGGACRRGDGGAGNGGGTSGPDGPVRPPDAPGTGPDGPPPCNEHTFVYTNATAQSVWVTGSWTSWGSTLAAGAIALEKTGDTWRKTVRIDPPGRVTYKLIVNGTMWIPDPGNPMQEPDGVGGQNSVLEVCGGQASCGDVATFDWRDAVLYFAMVDRFYDSDGRSDPVTGVTGGDPKTGPSGQYAGGDLAGVTMKMPYLSGLGVTALWLSAPYENRNVAGAAIDPASDSHTYSGYHGYWPSPDDIVYGAGNMATPRPKIESRIGTEADLRELVDTAHRSPSVAGTGIKVLFDYVMKHADTDSGLYRAHNDWFVRRNGSFALCGPENLWDDAYWGTRCAFTSYLAPFDYYNPAVRAWSINDAAWWVETFGIDGLRLDAIKHVPLDWLTELRTRLSRDIAMPAGGRFYLVGETFSYDDRDLLKRFVNPQTMLDGQFDFPWKARVCEAVFTAGGRMSDLATWMQGNDGFYGPGALMSPFIGNHDIPRAIHFANREIGNCRQGSDTGNGWTSNYRQPTDAAPYERLGLSYTVMLTNPGVPLVYYGDEVGLAGGGDPDNRRMMPWDDAQLSAPQKALRERFAKIAKLRAMNKVLARGQRVPISSDQDTWVYRMTGCGSASPDVVVALNRADAPKMVAIPAGSYDDLVAGQVVMGGQLMVPARGERILRARP